MIIYGKEFEDAKAIPEDLLYRLSIHGSYDHRVLGEDISMAIRTTKHLWSFLGSLIWRDLRNKFKK